MLKIVFALLSLSLFFQLDTRAVELHVLTYASKPHIGLDYLVDSCEENGIDLHIFGIESADYRGPPLPFPNYLEKIRGTLTGLNKSNIADDDIIMCVDAYDVLILAPKEVILSRFLECKTPFVMGADRVCLPYRDLALAYPPSPTSFRYVNPGCYIGYAKKVREILEWVILNPRFAGPRGFDRASFAFYFIRHRDEMALDYYNQIVLNCFRVERDEVVLDIPNKKLFFRETGIDPCVIHGSTDKRLYEEIRELFFGKKT